MSYELAKQLADEFEFMARQYKKEHKTAVSINIRNWIEVEARKMKCPVNGLWSARDVANKACEILAERLGEEYKFKLPRKLI
jgi:hypothetical protein